MRASVLTTALALSTLGFASEAIADTPAEMFPMQTGNVWMYTGHYLHSKYASSTSVDSRYHAGGGWTATELHGGPFHEYEVITHPQHPHLLTHDHYAWRPVFRFEYEEGQSWYYRRNECVAFDVTHQSTGEFEIDGEMVESRAYRFDYAPDHEDCESTPGLDYVQVAEGIGTVSYSQEALFFRLTYAMIDGEGYSFRGDHDTVRSWDLEMTMVLDGDVYLGNAPGFYRSPLQLGVVVRNIGWWYKYLSFAEDEFTAELLDEDGNVVLSRGISAIQDAMWMGPGETRHTYFNYAPVAAEEGQESPGPGMYTLRVRSNYNEQAVGSVELPLEIRHI